MGMIVFFSLLTYFALSAFGYLNGRLNTNSENARLSFDGLGNKLKAPTTFALRAIVVLVVAYGIYLGLLTMSEMPRDQHVRSVEKHQQYQQQEKHEVAESPTESKQLAVMTWFLPGLAGSGDPVDVVINRNDDEVMSFTSTYVNDSCGSEVQKTYFEWDKISDSSGTWHQDCPKDSGLWYLHKKEGSEIVFVGEESDQMNRVVQLKLVVDSKNGV